VEKVKQKDKKQKEKWAVKLRVEEDGERERLGIFEDEVVAACAWDDGVRMHGLDFPLNFPEGAPSEALEALQKWKDSKEKRGSSSSAYRGRVGEALLERKDGKERRFSSEYRGRMGGLECG
jgi:hypothetical protein